MTRFVWLGLVVLAVIGLWSAGWFYVAGQARAALLDQGGADAAASLTCERLDITGFPFRFDFACTGADITDGDVSVTVAGLRASVLVYNPTHAIVSAQSPLTLADAFTGAERRLDFASAEASVRLTTDDILAGLAGAGWRLARASLVADDLTLTDTLATELLLARAAHVEAHLLDMPERHAPATGLAGLAAYARAELVQAPALGIADGQLSLEAELTGVPDDLRRFADAEALPRWRDAGGQLHLVRLEATAADEFVRANGTLALDSAARLEGQIQLTSKGVVERAGTLIPEDWKGIVLGQQAADGSYAQTLNLRGGFVFAGLLPVAQLAPLF
ncbi:DUF2125 domain-containing protein [Devosia sp.]|uniref:DUF2125 domain-containing protein n=1 Tax=Devosia sp. TaxID=1871048 RepID=UPI002F24B954